MKSSQTLGLHASEHTSIRSKLEEFTRENPIYKQALVPAERLTFAQSLSALFFSFKPMPAFVIVLLLLIGGGAASAAAESALPGDALYPVKIHVNEAVQVAFAASTEAKARVQTDLAERRLDEVRALAVRGTINPVVQHQVADAIATQVNRARQSITTLSIGDGLAAAVDVNAQLEATLKAQQNIFARLAKDNEGSVDMIVTALHQADTVSAEAQVDLQTKIGAASVDAAHAIAQKGIDEAHKQADSMKAYLKTKGQELNRDMQTEVQAKLKSAEDAIGQAEVQLSAGASAQALDMAAQANADAREGQALGSLGKLLHSQKKDRENSSSENSMTTTSSNVSSNAATTSVSPSSSSSSHTPSSAYSSVSQAHSPSSANPSSVHQTATTSVSTSVELSDAGKINVEQTDGAHVDVHFETKTKTLNGD